MNVADGSGNNDDGDEGKWREGEGRGKDGEREGDVDIQERRGEHHAELRVNEFRRQLN